MYNTDFFLCMVLEVMGWTAKCCVDGADNQKFDTCRRTLPVLSLYPEWKTGYFLGCTFSDQSGARYMGF